MKSNAKVALITGANSGIGRVTATKLALQGFHVFLACRSEKKTQPVLEEIRVAGGIAEYIHLDLGSFDSVRSCADAFLRRELPLHLLINNAGIAGLKGMTESGFELSFGTCHMGHFLLTNLLLERMKESAPARIVVVASRAHRDVFGIDFEALRKPTQGPTGLKAYGVAKLANVLFAKELARRLEGTGVTTYSLHPGVVATNVWRAVPWPFDRLIKTVMITEEEGAQTTLFCATDPSVADQSGLYYVKKKPQKPSRTARNDALARELWAKSEQWIATVVK